MYKKLRGLSAIIAVMLLLGTGSVKAVNIYCIGKGTVNGQQLSEDPTQCVVVEDPYFLNTVEFKVKAERLLISTASGNNFNRNGFAENNAINSDNPDFKLSVSDLGKEFHLWYGIAREINPPDAIHEYIYKLVIGGINNSSSYLIVTLSEEDADEEAVLVSESAQVSFPNKKEGAKISFSIVSDNMVVTGIDKSEITATLAPYNNAADWPKKMSAKLLGNENEEIGKALIEEYEAIAGNEDSAELNIDGVYTEMENDKVMIESVENDGTVTAILPVVPCSGLYEMTVTIPGYEIKEPLQIAIYPNVLNGYYQTINDESQYNNLNINGITWTQASNSYAGIIQYPLYEDGSIFDQGRISDSRIFIPGLYFADIQIKWTEVANAMTESLNNNPRPLSSPNDLSGYEPYHNGDPFDLSGLVNGEKSYELYVHAAKNGAYAPVNGGNSDANFYITATKDAQLPTSVEAIGTEAITEDAVYYNLQGVRVDNPSDGIFVKLQGGKASKVVL